MVEIKNENKYNVGDKVWWFDAWGVKRWGVIFNIAEAESDGRVFAQIYEKGREGAQTGAELSKCWPDEETCIRKEEERAEAQVAEYKDSIKSVHDLVKFLFANDVSGGEYCDYEARKAAQERAAELGVPVE